MGKNSSQTCYNLFYPFFRLSDKPHSILSHSILSHSTQYIALHRMSFCNPDLIQSYAILVQSILFYFNSFSSINFIIILFLFHFIHFTSIPFHSIPADVFLLYTCHVLGRVTIFGLL